MCELQWYALAEVYINNLELQQEAYCLCSRVFIRGKDENHKINVSSADISASEDELQVEDDVSSTLPSVKLKNKKDDHESLSCYCSASHTDNLSTDEHDSLRDSHDTRILIKGLQSSDSGTDLTECIRHDLDIDWQRYWGVNGEKLIWESWITKYSAYINPEYLGQNQLQPKSDLNDLQPQHYLLTKSHEKFTFDKRDLSLLDFELSKSRLPLTNRLLLQRNFSISDEKLNTEMSEGWNPLSPLSIDCETDGEQLLSSKASIAGSSVRTFDSMTNVTHMTISSIDFNQSPHSSESFSSVSSIQSSLSSTSSSEEAEEDYQHQWNSLWKTHYKDEYLMQYNKFIIAWKEHNSIELTNCDKVENIIPKSPQKSHLPKKRLFKIAQNKIEDQSRTNSVIEVKQPVKSLRYYLENLKVSSGEENILIKEEKGLEEEGTMEKNKQQSNQDIKNEMIAMGLPLNFGNGNKCKRKQDEDFEEEDATNTSKFLTINDFDANRKRIKAAFNLLGIEFQENKTLITGNVQYRMKHIRLQNRHLRLRASDINKNKPKHTHFDDYGNVLVINDISSNLKVDDDNKTFQGILPFIMSEEKLSSADEEIVSNENNVEIQKTVVAECSVNESTKRRKRKKKLLVPPEIKDNLHLMKYWYKRFDLFSKFDEGIKLDEESWYSVTPENIAKHIAERCKCDLIIDGFCGAGGNSIQFAMTCKRVIAIDIDPKKIELARNNANVYGVADRIEFIVGDFFKVADKLKADVIFFSPPWGGPSYLKQVVYDLETMLLPVSITTLLEYARRITENIAVFLPRNSNAFLLIDHSKPGGGVEIEQNFMKKNLISITAYYNDLIKKKF